jgi:subtilase family serine protease
MKSARAHLAPFASRNRKRLQLDQLEDRNAPGETFGSLLWSPWDLIGPGGATDSTDVPFTPVRSEKELGSPVPAESSSMAFLPVGLQLPPSSSSSVKVADIGLAAPFPRPTAELDTSLSAASSFPLYVAASLSPPATPAGPIEVTAPTPASESANFVTVPADANTEVEPLLTVTPQRSPGGGGGGGGGGSVFTGYTPTQIRHAYGFDQLSGTGAGQTIAIVDAYDSPNIQADLNVFSSKFSLPTTTSSPPTFTFTVAYASGTKPAANASWEQETSLDVEWAHAIAPNANILLVEAASSQVTDMFAAVDYAAAHASVVSMSWGFYEGSGEVPYDSHFTVPGVTFLASSGDAGGRVEYPAASPYVVSVGGTSLKLDANNNRISETAWSSGGGGVSRYELLPGYQSTFGLSYSGRATPDVSYNANPNTGVLVYDSVSYFGMSGWLIAGGTSAGAPQWAALVALADAGRAPLHFSPLTSTDLTTSPIYTAATGTTIYSTNYFDVTSGSNGYPAGMGYDLATGLGSPNANNLIKYLINPT